MANDTKRFKNLKIQFTPSKQNNKSNSKAQEITQEQVQWQVNSSKMATLKRKKNCTKCRKIIIENSSIAGIIELLLPNITF